MKPSVAEKKTERLIDICTQNCGQMRARDPHQHQAAKGIEFFNSILHRFPVDHFFANRAMSPLNFSKPFESRYCLAFGSCFKYASQKASVSICAHWNT